jgi:hypothetical protein
MACCVLVGMGYTVEAAIDQVKAHREAADPEAWYIQNRIRKFSEGWGARAQPA